MRGRATLGTIESWPDDRLSLPLRRVRNQAFCGLSRHAGRCNRLENERRVTRPVKTPQELYQERNKRINDAIQLKVPDRVPIEMSFGYFPARYAGLPCSVVYYEPDKWLAAVKKTVVDFEPDGLFYIQALSPGKALETLDPGTTRWPGHGVPEDHGNQAIEGEWMKADEYDQVIGDPTDFLLRVYLPRTVGAMAPFARLPHLAAQGFGFGGAMTLAEALATPEMAAAIERLQQSGAGINGVAQANPGARSGNREARVSGGWHGGRGSAF